MASTLLQVQISRNKAENTPNHHVIAKPGASWTSYLSSWSSALSLGQDRDPQNKPPKSPSEKITGFRNPWPSYHKPTKQEMWDSLAFGADEDTCIPLAASHVPGLDSSDSSRATRDKQAAYLLRIEKPDFSFDSKSCSSKSTWLGHASILLQLPGLADSKPVRILFDPIFSMRCSPTQTVGPIRSYKPPCEIEDLPPVDIVLISHNHYDHLDYATIRELWKLHKSCIRFIVPLKTRKWFLDCGIDADRVDELDWWESASISGSGSENLLQITCTPAQHSSGRDGADADTALWSSWFLEHKPATGTPHKIFFAGDSGYQFHGSPTWPPQPPSNRSQTPSVSSKASNASSRPKTRRLLSRNKIDQAKDEYPPCPSFKEITDRLGSPQILYLPLALGATWAYFRSFFSDYLPDSIDPFPRHSPGVSAAIHMPPWDAVRVLNEMTQTASAETESEGKSGSASIPPIAIGIHWGTFVTDQTEVLKTLGQLEWACDQHDVVFARSSSSETSKRACFLALNHGQSVTV